MLIYKASLLNHTGIKPIRLPFLNVAEAKENIVKIGLQYGEPHMWYSVLDRPQKEFFLMCIGTGHDYPELSREQYIGSEIVLNGAYVWHYFLIDGETLKPQKTPFEKDEVFEDAEM